jgi:trk system potassium uptake protein TrkH
MRINILYIIKTLGSILILETIFLLVATGVAFAYGGTDRAPFLVA